MRVVYYVVRNLSRRVVHRRVFYAYDSNSRDDFGISHVMKIDERCLPYAEEMKTCGYCAEGEYLAVFGIASKLHVSEITALTDDERNAFFADVDRVAKALHAVFKPTKVNYGAYGDTGHHLHFHLVPKYSDDEFEWGGVFAMNPKRKFLSDAEYADLVAAIKAAL